MFYTKMPSLTLFIGLALITFTNHSGLAAFIQNIDNNLYRRIVIRTTTQECSDDPSSEPISSLSQTSSAQTMIEYGPVQRTGPFGPLNISREISRSLASSLRLKYNTSQNYSDDPSSEPIPSLSQTDNVRNAEDTNINQIMTYLNNMPRLETNYQDIVERLNADCARILATFS